MARGFFNGFVWGTLASGVSVAALSVANGAVMAPKPAVPDEVPSVALPVAPSREDAPRTRPEAPTAQAETTSPGLPDQPATGAQPDLQTQSAPTPKTPFVETAPAAPEAPQIVANEGLRSGPVDPVVTPDNGAQPTAPAADALRIATAPAAPPPGPPPAPETAPAPSGVDPVPSNNGGSNALAAGSENESEAPAPRQVAPPKVVSPEQEIAAAPMPDEVAIAKPVPTETAIADIEPPEVLTPPISPNVPTPPNVPVAPKVPGVASGPDATTETAPEVLQKPGVFTLSGEGRSNVGQGASDLSKLAPEVATNRLPTASGDVRSASVKPIMAFAQPPASAPDKPLMSIVLIDDGSLPLGLEALKTFPYPLTFAVDTMWEGAPQAMARYRKAGFEVMALANIPSEAQPSDVAVTMESVFSTLPEAVAVLEGDVTGLQASRDMAEQVAQLLAKSGHGLVLYPKGLNTAVSMAERAGVPAASLFRDFDGAGQDASVIRRFLDQAAFKAGQEGAVVMLGRLRADTISALLIWGLQDRASRVSLVPITSILTRDSDG